MTRFLTLFLLIVLPFSMYAQQEDELEIKNRTKRAVVQIKRLKEGALLVRLFDKSKQLDLLKQQEKSDEIIQSYKDKVASRNLEIIEAYTSKFTFCPVYFFYSKDSKLVAHGELDKVNFINNKGVIDTTITVSERFYYTSEISEKRTLNTHYKRVNVDTEDAYERMKQVNPAESSFEAVIIMDFLFIRTDPPFPYFARTFSQVPILKRSKEKAVERLNTKLEAFYNKYSFIEIDPETNELINTSLKKEDK